MTPHGSKMSQHLSQAQLAAYNERTLYPDELSTVDSHLASCDECHERLTRMALAKLTVSSVFESGEAPFHLDYEQHLEPYVEGTANEIEREIVDSHVALCSACATDLKDLLEFKREPVATTTVDTRTSSRWKQWFPKISFLPNPAWATAAIAVFVGIMGVVLWAAYPAFRQAEQADIGPPPSNNPTQGPVNEQPSPAPTEHIAQGTPPSIQPHKNGAIVPPPSNDQPLITVYDGNGQLVLTQRGRLEGLEELPQDLRASVERALTTPELPASPGLAGWSTDAGHLRGDTDLYGTFVPLAPTNVVVATDRPEFRWQALAAAQDYTVTIYDSNSRLVATSGPVTGTEWTTPTPLARGSVYSWQISAQKGGEKVVSPKPPLPEARFKVLDQRAFVTLAKLKKSVGRSHLAMGVFYWKHGLLAESEREFEALAKANPNSATVKALLASVRSIRGP